MACLLPEGTPFFVFVVETRFIASGLLSAGRAKYGRRQALIHLQSPRKKNLIQLVIQYFIPSSGISFGNGIPTAGIYGHSYSVPVLKNLPVIRAGPMGIVMVPFRTIHGLTLFQKTFYVAIRYSPGNATHGIALIWSKRIAFCESRNREEGIGLERKNVLTVGGNRLVRTVFGTACQ